MRRGLVATVVAALLVATLPALAVERPTGLERALQVASSTLENATGGAPDHVVEGRERAKAAIDAALARGNGNGNAFGRGHAADVLAILAAGGSPSELSSHGEAVRDLVHAYNELRGNAG